MATEANQRPRSRKLIENMLDERKEMLVLLWELYRMSSDEPDADFYDNLNQFLNVLVDYISAGHFGLYQRIAEGNERRMRVVQTAENIYPIIAETTQSALDFSEKYETPEQRNGDELINDLSKLGEDVATRIELEDRLIIAMLGDDYQIPEVESASTARA